MAMQLREGFEGKARKVIIRPEIKSTMQVNDYDFFSIKNNEMLRLTKSLNVFFFRVAHIV